jgi:hypothetical protein
MGKDTCVTAVARIDHNMSTIRKAMLRYPASTNPIRRPAIKTNKRFAENDKTKFDVDINPKCAISDTAPALNRNRGL